MPVLGLDPNVKPCYCNRIAPTSDCARCGTFNPHLDQRMNIQEIFGGIVNLLRHSEVHRLWTVDKVERLIIPPLQQNTFEIVQDSERHVVAFGTWAWVSDAVLGAFKAGSLFSGDDWLSGKNLVLCDVVAHDRRALPALIRAMRNRVPKGSFVHFMRDYKGNRRFSGAVA
jgi:hemolysin-activating ACP:hemolysin acyltransferase